MANSRIANLRRRGVMFAIWSLLEESGREADIVRSPSLAQSGHPNALSALGGIADIRWRKRQFAKHIRIADAILREFDHFLGDKSCHRIVTNFQFDLQERVLSA
jgi:hypothetical protein